MAEVAAVLLPSAAAATSSSSAFPRLSSSSKRKLSRSSLLPPRRVHLRPPPKPLLSDVLYDPAGHSSSSSSSATHNLLSYYARLASKLACDGKLRDFLMIAESVSAYGGGAISQFLSRTDPGLVSEGISLVLRERNLGEVLDFLLEASRIGFCPNSFFGDSAMDDLGVEFRRLIDDGRLVEFVELMETLVGHDFVIKDIVDPDYVLGKIVDKRDPQLAIRYASVFPHFQLLSCSIIEEFGKRHDIASVIRAFDTYKQKSGAINMFAYRAAIDACGSCGDFLRSRMIFERFLQFIASVIRAFDTFKQKSGAINMFAYRAAIDACGSCGDFLRSRMIFEELLAQNVAPNIYVLNSLMNVNAHDLDYTFRVYRHMQGLGISADATTYNILLKACCNTKKVDLAQDIYKDIKDKAEKGTVKLDVFTFSTMIKVFADAKMWQLAFSIKEDMQKANTRLNMVTWSSLISACANSGLVDQAIQTFEEMLMTGCEPNTQCCNSILYACVVSCQYDRAFRLFYAWKETGIRMPSDIKTKNDDKASITLAEGSSSTSKRYSSKSMSDFDKKSLHAVKVVPFRPTVFTCNILMKACGTDYNRANALMNEMKTLGIIPNHISWSILIDIYGSAQNIRGAMQALRAMQDNGIKLDVIAYTTAIKACVANKKFKLAFSLFEEMKRFQIQPNWVTYNTLLRARDRYRSLHEVQQCLKIYQDMRKAGFSPNDCFLKQLIEEWCEGVLWSKYNNQDPMDVGNNDKNEMRKPYNLLLEKVAIHLQKDGSGRQAIDIRGLTKIEARIVVLSVLRMIKESYALGNLIANDIIVMAEKEKEGMSFYELDAQHALTKLLQDELGLDVRAGHGTPPYDLEHDKGVLQSASGTPKAGSKVRVRRPRELGILKITKESLLRWLQKGGNRPESV